jgi:hypothetical protein
MSYGKIHGHICTCPTLYDIYEKKKMRWMISERHLRVGREGTLIYVISPNTFIALSFDLLPRWRRKSPRHSNAGNRNQQRSTTLPSLHSLECIIQSNVVKWWSCRV